MTIWLIAERTKYDDGEADYDTPEERYGYFLTEDDAARRIALIYEGHRDKYDKYVQDELRENDADIRAYETAVIKADILRANGFPDEPYPGRVCPRLLQAFIFRKVAARTSYAQHRVRSLSAGAW